MKRVLRDVSLVARNLRASLFRAREAAVALRALDAAVPASCPLCGYNGAFRSHGIRPRPDALCPQCGSVERHRLLKLFLDEHRSLISGKRVLHFAPERTITQLLKSLEPAVYQSADLFKPADLKLNIEQIELPDASVDAIICCHVLEHVDDRRALRELRRILTPGGTLIAMVPLVEGWDETFEPADVTTPEERMFYFGHPGHLRFYGRDFVERMAVAGFKVSAFAADGRRSPQAALRRGEKIFIGRVS